MEKAFFVSLAFAASFVAMTGTQEAFADSAPVLQHAAPGQNVHHREMSESLSVASAFDWPSQPRTFTRNLSDGLSVSTGFNTPAQQMQAYGPVQQRTNNSPTPVATQRADERLTFRSVSKLATTSTAGTPYDSAISAFSGQQQVQTQEQADQVLQEVLNASGDGVDPDSSSRLLEQLTAYSAYVAMEKSTQNAILVNAGMSALLLAGALAVVVARQPVVSEGRVQKRVLALFVLKRQADAVSGGRGRVSITYIFLVVFAVFAASSLAVTAAPSAGQEYTDNPAKAQIDLSSAYHLDSEGKLVDDIYEQLRDLDGLWSDEIPDGHYVRVTFAEGITSNRDITIYPRVVSDSPRIEVYERGGTEPVAEFVYVGSNEYNKLYLKNLQGSQDSFDLRVVGGSVEFDHIVDPFPIPTYVGAGSIFNSASSGTVGLPSGLQADDVLLLFIETDNEAVSVTSNGSAGTWTQVTNSPQGINTPANSGGTGTATRLTVFWARYPGSGTTGPTISDSGNHQIARILAFRGVITSGNPFDITSGGTESTADTSGSIPGATTTVANTLVVMAIATSLPDASSTTNFSGWSNAGLANVTERTDNTATANNGGGLGIATGEKATAGSYGTTSVTLANSAAKGMMTIALRPPPPAQPALSISQPDGTGDSVTVGDPYNITYTLSDPDSVTTVAFFYDTNNTGLDGTAISGECATAPEGTNVTCEWDTTGVTPGTYYVYGITDDGETSAVSTYSSGQITINPQPNAPIFHPSDGSNQIAFNNILENTTTPTFRTSATSTSSFNRFQLELNTASNFSGTAYTQTFSGTYASGTQYNLTANGLSPSLPTTDGVTYYVRVRASANSGAGWGDWSSGTWSFTKGSVTYPDWFQTTDAQFATGILNNVATTGSGSVQLSSSAITFRAATSATVTSGTSLTVDKPTGTVEGDVMVAAVAVREAQQTVTPPSGWQTARTDFTTGGLNIRQVIFYKVAGASEPSSYQFTLGSGITGAIGIISTFSGVDTSNPVDVHNGQESTGSSTNIVAPSVTTAVNNAMIVTAYSVTSGGTPGSSWTAPSGMTEAAENSSVSGSGGISGGMDYGVQSSPGASGTKTAAVSGHNETYGAASIIALRPALQGTIRSSTIDFDWAPDANTWGTFDWSENETNGSISVQLYYDSGSGIVVVPDSVLPGNVAGFSSGPVDISGLNTATYNELYLLATLTGSGDSPLLLDWKLTWSFMQLFDRGASDGVQISDTITAKITGISITDSLNVTDTLIGKVTRRVISDSVSVTDGVTARVTTRAIVDQLSVTDNISAKITTAAIADSLQVTDAIVAKITGRAISDILTVTDEITSKVTARAISDELSVTDSIAAKVTGRAISDSLTVTDEIVAKVTAAATSDELGIVDQVTAKITGVAVSEELLVTDALTAKVTARAISDTLQVTDQVTAKIAGTAISDSLGVTDAVTAKITARAISETLGVTDSVTGEITTTIIPETLVITDSVVAKITGVAISDDLGVTDEATARIVAVGLSDQVGVTDEIVAKVTAKATSEDLLVTDTVIAKVTARAILDIVQVTDEVTARVSGTTMLDSLLIVDSINMAVSKEVPDVLDIDDNIVTRVRIFIPEVLALSDEIRLGPRPADSVDVTDGVSKSVAKGVADLLTVADGVTAKITGVAISDELELLDEIARPGIPLNETLTVTDTPTPKVAYVREIDDGLSATDSIFQPPMPRESITITDSVSVGLFRFANENIGISDEASRGWFISISDPLQVIAVLTDVSWTRTLAFDEQLGLATEMCLPGLCDTNQLVSHNLDLQDSLELMLIPPPELEETLSVNDLITLGLKVSAVPPITESLTVTDTVTARLIGILVVENKESIGPMPSTAITGTYTYTGNAADLKNAVMPVPIPINGTVVRSDLPNQMTVLRTYSVPVVWSSGIPTNSVIMSEPHLEIPALSNMFMRLNFNETSSLASHRDFISMLDIEFTPKVDATDFGLVVAVTDKPTFVPLPSGQLKPIYLDIRWWGAFPGAENPSTQEYYQNLPKFTFTVNDQWVEDNNVLRDAQGWPILNLWLLDEGTNQWQQITSITKVTASGGTYTFSATLPHFSNYALTANVEAGGGGGRATISGAYSRHLIESISMQEGMQMTALNIVEEFGGSHKKISVFLSDLVAVRSKPVVLSAEIELDRNVMVQMRLEELKQASLTDLGAVIDLFFNPSMLAEIEVKITNTGQEDRQFEFMFTYDDVQNNLQNSLHSQRVVLDVGGGSTRTERVQIPFTEPGVYVITVEVRNLPGGDLAGFNTLTVEIPWFGLYRYITFAAAGVILGLSGIAIAIYLLQRRNPRNRWSF